MPILKVWLGLTLLLLAISMEMPCAAQHTNGSITIHQKRVPYKLALETAEKQSGYIFNYSDSNFFDWPRVDLDLTGATVLEFIETFFAGLNYTSTFYGKIIVIHRVPPTSNLYLNLKGRVLNTQNEPLPLATVSIAGGHQQVLTKEDGSFSLPVTAFETLVTISYSGYLPLQIVLSNRKHDQDIVLQLAAVNLNEAQVEAYGKTTQRLSTGTISTLKGEAIRIQPVTNVLDVLAGQIPGLSIRRVSGVSGSTYETLLGGRHSIAQGNEPLFVVDGVPLASSSFIGTIGPGSSLGSGGASTLNGIPPGAIASVSVLKGPAATAIYGSRAANGVILITLKEGAAGALYYTADVTSGWERSVRVSQFLNTKQFLALREEAAGNDSKAINATTVPELAWDTTRYTDYQHLVLGRTGYFHDVRVGFTGGNNRNSFLVSGILHAQNTIFPGETKDTRASLYGNWHYRSENSRLRLAVSGLYSNQSENLPLEDLTGYQGLAPNAPAFLDASGQPVWSSQGLSFINIPALTNNTYRLGVYNFLGHLQSVWQVAKPLSLEASLGIFHIGANEEGTTRLVGQDPGLQPPPTGTSNNSRNDYQSNITEVLARYAPRLPGGLLELIVGGTWQGERRDSSALTIGGYPDDLVLATGNGGTVYSSSKERVDYRYLALFSRARYNIGKKYILEGSARRDGSSRWGPGHQFGTFWSFGGGWIFSEEPFFQPLKKTFSFAKLRGSYGKTGNDQTDDNQFAQVYTPVASQNGQQGVIPATLYNPDLHWEKSYATELGLELGLLQDKVFFSVTGYQSKSKDQILTTTVAGQAGGVSVVANKPVQVNNTSLEMSLRANNLSLGPVSWTPVINLTLARNKLQRFPDLANTSYNSTLEVGKSLTVSKGLHYLGVNRKTGLYQFQDLNNDGLLNAGDVRASPSKDPRYYGGLSNTFSWKGWRLDIVTTFCAQNGDNPLVTLSRQNAPGMLAPSELSNGPVEWLDHWRKPGDNALQQRLTTGKDKDALTARGNYLKSDANTIDASYLRIKTVSLSYQLGENTLNRWGLKKLQFYLRAQDPWTFTHYRVWDPETQNPLTLPTSRTWVAGFSLTL